MCFEEKKVETRLNLKKLNERFGEKHCKTSGWPPRTSNMFDSKDDFAMHRPPRPRGLSTYFGQVNTANCRQNRSVPLLGPTPQAARSTVLCVFTLQCLRQKLGLIHIDSLKLADVISCHDQAG